jgi:hypothetical protein
MWHLQNLFTPNTCNLSPATLWQPPRRVELERRQLPQKITRSGCRVLASDFGSSRRHSCNACHVLGDVIGIGTALVVILGGTPVYLDIDAGLVG